MPNYLGSKVRDKSLPAPAVEAALKAFARRQQSPSSSRSCAVVISSGSYPSTAPSTLLPKLASWVVDADVCDDCGLHPGRKCALAVIIREIALTGSCELPADTTNTHGWHRKSELSGSKRSQLNIGKVCRLIA